MIKSLLLVTIFVCILPNFAWADHLGIELENFEQFSEIQSFAEYLVETPRNSIVLENRVVSFLLPVNGDLPLFFYGKYNRNKDSKSEFITDRHGRTLLLPKKKGKIYSENVSDVKFPRLTMRQKGVLQKISDQSVSNFNFSLIEFDQSLPREQLDKYHKRGLPHAAKLRKARHDIIGAATILTSIGAFAIYIVSNGNTGYWIPLSEHVSSVVVTTALMTTMYFPGGPGKNRKVFLAKLLFASALVVGYQVGWEVIVTPEHITNGRIDWFDLTAGLGAWAIVTSASLRAEFGKVPLLELLKKVKRSVIRKCLHALW